MKITDPAGITRESMLPVLKDCFGENLRSVILYGSAVTDSFNQKTSDINLLVLLGKNNGKDLVSLGKKGKKLINRHRFTLLALTVDEFLSSSDVFPMEYNDLLDSHSVIHGEDITGELEINNENIRHQLEERLRGAANQLRQLLIASAGNRRILASGLSSYPGIIKTLLRSALRLRGADLKTLKGNEIFTETLKLYSIDFHKALEPLLNTQKSDVTASALLLLESLEKLAAEVDSMGRMK